MIIVTKLILDKDIIVISIENMTKKCRKVSGGGETITITITITVQQCTKIILKVCKWQALGEGGKARMERNGNNLSAYIMF